MEPIRDVELLPVPLAEGGKADKLEQLLALNRALQDEKDARHDDNRAHTKRINQLEQDIQELMENTAQQIEMRSVGTLKHVDLETGTIRKVREDTGEVLFDRAMTAAEREEFGLPPAEDAEPPKKRGRPKSSKSRGKDTEAQAAAAAVNGTSNGSGQPESAPPEDDGCICADYFGKETGTEWDCPVCGPRYISQFGEHLPRQQAGPTA